MAGSGEPAAQDGWRIGGLPALRAELDRIDNAIHDLLMRRAEVVEHVARSGKPAAFRPGREASIIRRLLARHQGALPAVSVVRIWRELLAGTTAMQGGFSLAVCDADQGAPMTQLAREHFGALTPLRAYASAGQALVGCQPGRRIGRGAAVSVGERHLVGRAASSRAAVACHRPPAVLDTTSGWSARRAGFGCCRHARGCQRGGSVLAWPGVRQRCQPDTTVERIGGRPD